MYEIKRPKRVSFMRGYLMVRFEVTRSLVILHGVDFPSDDGTPIGLHLIEAVVLSRTTSDRYLFNRTSFS